MKRIHKFDIVMQNVSNLATLDGELIQVDDARRAFITGSSITGAMRQFISAEFSDDFAEWCFEENKIFVSDALCEDDIEIVERVSTEIDQFGAAKPGHLHSRMSIKKGYNFSFNIKIFDYSEAIQKVKHAIVKALYSFDLGLIRLGSYTSVGYGAFKVQSLREKTYDLTNKAEFKAYLGDEPCTNDVLKEPFEHRSLIVEVSGSFENGVFVAGDKPLESGAADAVPLRDGADYIVPGSSLKGVFRNYFTRVDHYKGQQIAESLVGSNDSASIITFEDAVLDNPKICKYDKIRIDMITGGTMNGAKALTEVVNGDVTFRIIVSKRDKLGDEQRRYLLMALRDFANGRLTIGSSFASGKGHFIASEAGIKIIDGKTHLVDFSDQNDAYLVDCK